MRISLTSAADSRLITARAERCKWLFADRAHARPSCLRRTIKIVASLMLLAQLSGCGGRLDDATLHYLSICRTAHSMQSEKDRIYIDSLVSQDAAPDYRALIHAFDAGQVPPDKLACSPFAHSAFEKRLFSPGLGEQAFWREHSVVFVLLAQDLYRRSCHASETAIWERSRRGLLVLANHLQGVDWESECFAKYIAWALFYKTTAAGDKDVLHALGYDKSALSKFVAETFRPYDWSRVESGD